VKELERLSRLEAMYESQQEAIEEIKQDVKEIKDMLMNGYLERKIKQTIHAMLGSTILKIIFSVVTSSVVLSWLLSKVW